MRWSTWVLAAVLGLSVAPLTARAQFKDSDLKGRDVTLRGCVHQGAKKGHYVLTEFSQVASASEVSFPRTLSDGRPVFFWFEDLPKLDKYFNQMVEVRGELLGSREGDLDPQFRNGQQIIQVDGPGKNVDVTPDEALRVVGTTGTLPQKALFLRVDVDDVTPTGGGCN